MSPQTLTGYYRYTDIWFDWASRLPNAEDGLVLKAILAHDALVHPEHPLRVRGIDGAQLYIGHLESGEARLLFSSAQVDYIRYWLYATGMTKETIPLPWSDCLLTMSDLKTVTTMVFKDGGSLKNALKMVDKNNKRLKGSRNSDLTHRRHTFERVRSLWAAQQGVWCAMDFEDWEFDHTVNTEFGWRLVGWKDGQKIEDHGHLIVEEARHYRNGRYVADQRDNYQFGESEVIKKVEFKKRICSLITGLRSYGPVYLVFHDDTQDIKTLNKLNAPLDGISYILPDLTPIEGIFVLDTADLIGALLGEQGGNRRGLEKMARLLQQNPAYLHNAGNDAYYTLSCMIEMAGGEHVDLQREKRWPNQTAPGSLWVKVKPGQEGSDDDFDEPDTGDEPKLGYDPTTGKLYRMDIDTDDEED